jgi:hypothetical protein
MSRSGRSGVFVQVWMNNHGSAGPSRPASGTREGLDAEETRSPITQHRADNSRRVGDPPLGREQASEGDGYLATGRRLGHRAAIRGNAGASVHDASRTSDPGRHRARAPHEEARSEQAGGRRSARTASERDQGDVATLKREQSRINAEVAEAESRLATDGEKLEQAKQTIDLALDLAKDWRRQQEPRSLPSLT